MKTKIAILMSPFSKALWAVRGRLLRSALVGLDPAPLIDLKLEKDWGRVAVIGRGSSASAFISSGQAYQTVIICNFLDIELGYPGMLTRLQESGAVVYLGNRSETIPSMKLAMKLPLSAVTWTGLSGVWASDRRRIIGRLSGLGLTVQNLPDDFTPTMFEQSRNAGLVGITLAALRSKEVDLFGFDFYEGTYLTGSLDEGWGNAKLSYSRKEYGRNIKERFLRIIADFPGTYFEIHTSANLELSSNAKLIGELRAD